MKLPFTEEQWKAAHKAGITDRNYLEEDILDGIVAILESCVYLKMSYNGDTRIYQDMLDKVNAMFED